MNALRRHLERHRTDRMRRGAWCATLRGALALGITATAGRLFGAAV